MEIKAETRGRKPGTPKTGGRKPGTPNKHVTDKDYILELLTNNRKKLKQELDTLKGAEFCALYLELYNLCKEL